MEGLWSEVLKLAAVVEDALNQSIHGLCDGRSELASDLKGEARAVDRWEVQIERECVRVLALHQPVASDLRRVAAILKINGDLERLYDLARHIAKRVKKLAADPPRLADSSISRKSRHAGAVTNTRQPRRIDPGRRGRVLMRLSPPIKRSTAMYRAVQKQLKTEDSP